MALNYFHSLHILPLAGAESAVALALLVAFYPLRYNGFLKGPLGKSELIQHLIQ